MNTFCLPGCTCVAVHRNFFETLLCDKCILEPRHLNHLDTRTKSDFKHEIESLISCHFTKCPCTNCKNHDNNIDILRCKNCILDERERVRANQQQDSGRESLDEIESLLFELA